MKSDVSGFAARSIQIAFLAIVAGIWYGLSRTGGVSPLFLPPIDQVWNASVRLVQTGQFWSAVRVTLLTIAQAWLIAIVLGILVAYAVTRSRFVTDMVEPVISGVFSVPLTLLFPLFILFFGIGPESKVAYGATYGFFPVALNTIAGLAGVDQRYLRAARSMGASAFDTFRHVLLPAAFPVILTGLRISFFITFASVLGGETLSAAAGVGRNIALAAELMEPARMYAWIVFVLLTSIVLNSLVSQVETSRREF
jgi:ABC-type nitrate/sulfonate/bicarbonate transport system permease component